MAGREIRLDFPPHLVIAYAALMGVAWVAHSGAGVIHWAFLLFSLQSGLDWVTAARRLSSLRGALGVIFSLAWVAVSGAGGSPLWPGLIPVAGGLGAVLARIRGASLYILAILGGYAVMAGLAGLPPGVVVFRLGLIAFVASSLGVMLRRIISQRERAEASERRVRALLSAAQGITGELDLKATLESILDRVVELLNVEKAAILLEEPETGKLRVVAARGVAPSEWSKVVLSSRGSLAEEVMKRGRSRMVERGEDIGTEGEGFKELGMRGIAIVPLSVGEEKLGMLIVSNRRERPLLVEDLEVLRLFGTFAAVAIHKAKAHRRTEEALRSSEKRVGRLKVIAEIGRQISLTRTMDELIERTLEGICDRLGYEGGALLVSQVGEPEHLKVASSKGILEGMSKEAKVDLLGSEIGRDLRDGRPVLVRNIEHVKDAGVRALLKPLGVRSVLLVPVLVHGQARGAIEVASTEPGALGDEAVAEMEMLAAFVASGMEDVELHVELRRRAEELERAYEELQRSQEQLIRAARLATVGELAAIVAHELNNPLTAILGYSQLAMAQIEDGSPLKEDLKVIEGEALRTKEIVRRLLDFAREVRPKTVEFDLNEVVEESVKVLAYELEASNIKVEKDLDPSLPKVMADPGQIRQVLTNMIVNAKDAMEPKGGGTLRLATRSREPGWVEVEISDTGVGIPPEHLPRIFDPFFTTKEPGKGTGLGLTVCHRIVSQHGGRIEVESQVGEGTTFRVILPVRGKVEQ